MHILHIDGEKKGQFPDPAKRKWYAKCRQQRYSKFVTNPDSIGEMIARLDAKNAKKPIK